MEAQAMVSASTGAMNSVLSKLATLLEDDRNPRTRNSIIALRCALTSMRSFLEWRAASMEDMGTLVEGWMKQVRDMSYDLEDCIDDFVRSAAPGNTNWVAQLLKVVTWRRQYTSLLQELKEQVCEASERRWRYGIVYDPGDPLSIPSDVVPIDGLLPVFSPHRGDGFICGVEGPRDRLIKLLDPDDQQQLKMVSIVGSRGIGKTLLAMEVYESLKERFHCHTILSVSRGHDLRMILISILSQVGLQEQDFRGCDEEQLIHKLSEFLKTRRYFIVIEDIWDVSAWKIIRWAFPDNGYGSRILVTTCIISLASPSCYFGEDHIFKMAPLSDAEARKLFFMRIFHPDYCCPLRLEGISFDILKKCGGIPLAIITIASLLSTKADENEWKRVRDAIGSVLDESATLEWMKQILHFEYSDLPFHLRTCLLYLTIFPEGYIIDKRQLIRRWMGEGFIIEEHGKSLEEVGECYFNELINRGLIQPVSIQYDGQVETCQVQNMMLDLILSKSAEENFVTSYDDSSCIFGLQERIRRLSLYCGHDKKDSFIPSATTASHIRSLTIFMTNKEMPILANFRALRVLDLESSVELEDANYLQNIGNPCLLKYLRLQTTSFIELPEQVVELQFLQTLDLTCALISRLPCSIVRLKELTYLLVKNVKLPDGIGYLQALQELSHLELESSNSPNSLEELGRLSRLRVLGLNWCISDTDTSMEICADSLISSLDKLGTSNLQSLHIGTGSGCSLDFLLDSLSAPFNHLLEFRMTSDYYFPRIPGWMTTLVSLKLLQINIDTVGEEALSILGKLPSLLVLLLSVKSAVPNHGLVIRSCEFLCLKQFDFICWNSLDMVMFEQGSMLALETLHLNFWPKGVFLNCGFRLCIEHISSLRYLHVDIDCKDTEAREVEAAEDAIRGAISAHPSHPKLKIQRLGEEDLMMDEVEITVHAEGACGHSDVKSVEMVEEKIISPAVSMVEEKELISPAESPWWLVPAWWVISMWCIVSAWGVIPTWGVISAWWIISVYGWWVISEWWLVSPWCVSPLCAVPTLWVVSGWWVAPKWWWLVSQWRFTAVLSWAGKIVGFLPRTLLLVFGYAYPAYECYKTGELNKPNIEQQQQLILYWILVALMTVLESIGDSTISWLPFYSEAKLVFLIYLWYPRTKGPTYIYSTFFKLYISQHENKISRYFLEMIAWACGVLGFYFKTAATVGHNIHVLKYVASRSQSQKSKKQQRSQFKALENLLRQEKMEIEEILTREKTGLEEEHPHVCNELQKANKQRAELENKLLQTNSLMEDHAVKQAEEMCQINGNSVFDSTSVVALTEFTYKEVKEATNNFDVSKKIGDGGSGSVYKGFLRHTTVAIKKLNGEGTTGDKEFNDEVETLCRMRHPNFVTLIGVCREAKALILEFMSNGSLEDCLQCMNQREPLSWRMRIRISADICTGLIFLHSNKPNGIAHGDLKPGNVLLDTGFVCKLADFGNSRPLNLMNTTDTPCHHTDEIKGTIGYMDPGYIASGELTAQYDVYSFGVVLMQLLTGKGPLGLWYEVEAALSNDMLPDIIDTSSGEWPPNYTEKLARLALKCCRYDRKERPDLEKEVWGVLQAMMN